MLWLSPGYRVMQLAVVGLTVAIGCRSARVPVMKLVLLELESRQTLISHPIHIRIPPCPWSHACKITWSCQLGDLESMHACLGSIPKIVACT
jgi:hypothetical protein